MTERRDPVPAVAPGVAPTTTSSAVATPIEAATVVILRPARRGSGFEVLLTHRPDTMAFGPGIAVFPGGRVDVADRAVASDPSSTSTAVDPLAAQRVAAAREAREEVGIELDPGSLIPMTRWVTPPSMPRRFDVRFFAAALPAGARVRRHRREVAAVDWVTPDAALRAMAAGRLAIWQPTAVTMQQLDGIASIAEVRRTFAPSAGRAPSRMRIGASGRVPGLARIDGGWAGGIEGRRWTGWLFGRREFVVVDPGDPTDETLAAVAGFAASRGGRLVGAALTSLHPERHAGVEMFHSGLDLPVVAGPGAGRLASYAVTELAPGVRLPFGDVGASVAAQTSTAATARAEGIDLVLEDGTRLMGGAAGR